MCTTNQMSLYQIAKYVLSIKSHYTKSPICTINEISLYQSVKYLPYTKCHYTHVYKYVPSTTFHNICCCCCSYCQQPTIQSVQQTTWPRGSIHTIGQSQQMRM